VTRRLDCDGAGYPLPIANIDCSRDAENVTPNKGPPACDAERVFESDSSFSCFAMQPQTKGVKSAKKTKKPKRASGGFRPAKGLADSTNMNALRNAKISLAFKKKSCSRCGEVHGVLLEARHKRHVQRNKTSYRAWLVRPRVCGVY
jgi:hypothetical protein